MYLYSFSSLFKIIKAPMTPGTHAQRVSKKTIMIDPQPLSTTASGGKRMDKITLNMLIGFYFVNAQMHPLGFIQSTSIVEISTNKLWFIKKPIKK
jgi:hypothetical protein